MRLKHVKGAKEKIEASSYNLSEPETYKGKFQKIFPKKQPIFLEIGMGKGNFIVENAKKYPDKNFIGIEKFDSVMVKAIEKAEQQELPNLKMIRMDATEIESIFDHEIDTIYLNFSDPWPKNRHDHRRLTSPRFLKRYDTIFKEKKHIIMKTDNRKLFEYSLISFSNYGYTIEKLSLDLHKDNPEDNIETEYEQKFVKKGCTIYQVEVTKK